MNTKLYVGNLSYDTTEGELQDAFAQVGAVTEVHLVTDKMNGRSRGFAFVTMGSPEDAQAAIEKLSGQNIGGRTITVNEARPREERGDYHGKKKFSGGGSGGSGGFRRRPRS